MMAGIFLVATAALIAVLSNHRRWAFTLLALGLIFSILMFYHHATDTLKINW